MATVNTAAELITAVANQTFIELDEGNIVLTAALACPAALRVIKGKGKYVSFIEGAHATADLIDVAAGGTLILQDVTIRTDGTGQVIDAAAITTVELVDSRALGPVTTAGTLKTSGGSETLTVTYSGAGASAGSEAAVLVITNAAAKGTTEVHALIDTTAITDTTTGFTNPDVPRNLRVTKAASWDGGTVTVTGTDTFDQVITEEFTAAGAGLEVGLKAFKTVTASRHSIALAGGNGYSIGCGDSLGATRRLANTQLALFADATKEAATVSLVYQTIIPTTVPDGAVDYTIFANVLA